MSMILPASAQVLPLEPTGVWVDVTPADMDLDSGGDNFGNSGQPVVDPANPLRGWVGADYQGVWITNDAFKTFTKISAVGSPVSGGKIWGMGIALDGRLYAATGNNFTNPVDGWLRLFTSTDLGVTWTSAAVTDYGWQPYQCEASPFDAATLLATTHGSSSGDDPTVKLSTDRGVTFSNIFNPNKGNSGYAYWGLADPPTIIFVADEGGAGADATQVWAFNGSVWGLAQIDDQYHYHGSHQLWTDHVNGVLYNPGPLGVKRSLDNGLTWELVSSGAGRDSGAAVATPTRVYAGRGYASQGTFAPQLQDAPLNGASGSWVPRSAPAGMFNGPRSIAVTQNVAGQRVLLATCWTAGLWRYVEAA